MKITLFTEGVLSMSNANVSNAPQCSDPPKATKPLKLIRMSDVEATEIKWLWYPYVSEVK